MAYIEQEDIFAATNGGLDVILRYYPNAADNVNNPNKKFKIRGTEKTASANVKKLDNGVWVVTDFGGDQVSRNAIQIVMLEENVSFKQALDHIAQMFNVKGASDLSLFRPEFDERPANADEEEGEYYFILKEEISDSEMEVLGPTAKREKCKLYNLYSVAEMRHIKDRICKITRSTDNYPIFLVDEGSFKKVLQPKNSNKAFRFFYIGKRPKDYVMGLRQIERFVNEKRVEELNKAGEENPEQDEQKRSNNWKLPEIILCSGERDALNVAGMGYWVIWFNSETVNITGEIYKKIMNCCNELYNLPDIDKTGIREGTNLAIKFLDIKTIWLPEELKERRDFRGNPCKDVRDYLSYYKEKDFKELVRTALPARMWDEYYTEKGLKYEFNNVQTYYFLRLNGFYRYKSEASKSGYIFIQIKGNIVRDVEPDDVKGFIHTFLQERKMPATLRNMFYRTNQLSESSLSNLSVIEIDFTDFTKDSQYFFFQNKTWVVTKNDIQEFREGEVDRYVWEHEVINHRVKLMDPMFSTEYNEDQEQHRVKILNKDSLFFQYLINTSRVHWRKEMEQEQELNDEEKAEQELHLLNKIYSLGYLLHRYKDPSRPWCVFAMDNKISEESESHGGSGKSICYKAPRYFMEGAYITLPGRNAKLTDNPHIWENVTEHTDMILIDDANRYLKFDFFFSILTGELTVNPKNAKQYEIPFDKVPKMCITSNYTLNQIDPSTERRLLYTVFSDYYHHNSGSEYEESRSPKDDFGKNLFFDFDENDWNLFINFMVQCVQVYLKYDKIEPPMDNVNKRNLQSQMTEAFKAWADVYFSEESTNSNTAIVRQVALEDMAKATGLRNWTTQRFTKAIKAWCKYYGHIYNPKDQCTDAEHQRIVSKHDGKTVDMIYIARAGVTLPVKDITQALF